MGVGCFGFEDSRGCHVEGKGGNVAIYREDFSEEIESVGSPSPSTSRDACLSTWTSSGEPKKSQDR
jgi:hypothetical protein